MPTISVVTATFNRAHTLGRAYDSLLEQTFTDFEWVIVDDGSDDDTGTLVEAWTSGNAIAIKYLRQANRGMHVALNRGVGLAAGEFITVLDSDDWFLPETLETLLSGWGTVPSAERASFAGIVGLCSGPDAEIVGDRFPAEPFDCSSAELFYVHGIAGDKHSMLRADVYREFPFPFEEDATIRWIPTAIAWNRMSLKYRQRHVNRVVKVVDYQPGGLSDRKLALQVRYPTPVRQFLLEELRLPFALSVRRRLRSYANYTRFSLHAGVAIARQGREAPSRIRWLALLPLGCGLYVRDRWRLRRRSHERDDAVSGVTR